MNILESLFLGELSGNEKFTRPSGLGEVIEIMEEQQDLLMESIQDNDKKHLLNLVNASEEAMGIASLEQYIKGFRVGARFILDTFVIDPDCILRK